MFASFHIFQNYNSFATFLPICKSSVSSHHSSSWWPPFSAANVDTHFHTSVFQVYTSFPILSMLSKHLLLSVFNSQLWSSCSSTSIPLQGEELSVALFEIFSHSDTFLKPGFLYWPSTIAFLPWVRVSSHCWLLKQIIFKTSKMHPIWTFSPQFISQDPPCTSARILSPKDRSFN